MTNFGFMELKTQFGKWSEHHKTLGVFVKREYKDGEVVITQDKLMQDYCEKYPDRLKSKHIRTFSKIDQKQREAVDFFFLIDNLEYQESNIESYDVGASNAEQITSIRLKFLLGSNLLILDHEYKTEGSFARTFCNLINSNNCVEDIINEIMDLESPLEEVGISKNDSGTVNIIVANDISYPDVIEDIEINEVYKSLVAVEIYKHTEIIH
ncbi:hypothetical protein ABC382_00670 [Lysinibacillus sp. 1P01SD]|uniref:hypothetical protein n=1 Tax=Lysinibacillus sp. 1P01SD TaxID=3132285 RepID=UPI00399F9065